MVFAAILNQQTGWSHKIYDKYQRNTDEQFSVVSNVSVNLKYWTKNISFVALSLRILKTKIVC